MATTFNGWPVLKHPGKGVFVAPNGKSVYCADNDVAEVFRYVAEQWHKRIEPLPKAAYNTYPNERKGYLVIHCSRPLGSGVGTGNRSNHVSHTAMDILGDKHHYEASCRTGACYGPQGRPHPWVKGFNTRQERELRAIRSEIAAFAGGRQILRLGLDFAVGKRDGMHVEIAPGTTNADVKRAADSLRRARSAPKPDPTPAPPQEDPPMSAEEVKEIKAAITASEKAITSHINRRTTVSISDATASWLHTGKTVWSLSGFLNLVGNRIGRTDGRVLDMPARIANAHIPRPGNEGSYSLASVWRGTNSATKRGSQNALAALNATTATLSVLNDVAAGTVKISDVTGQIKAALDEALANSTAASAAEDEEEITVASVADDPDGDEDGHDTQEVAS